MVSKSINDLRRGMSLYHVWIHQAYHELSSKYQRTILGSIWISGAMLASSLALSIVMGGIMKQNLADTLPYIMGGILCFALPGYLLSEAPEVYMASSSIIKNNAYPFTYYTFESVTRTYIVFLHNLVVFYLALLVLQRLAVPNWTVILSLPIVYINSVVWGTLVSMMAARFRDLRFLLPFMSQIVFFLTPVFWRPDNLTGWRTIILKVNPFFGLMEIVRAPLLGHYPPMEAWYLSLASLGLGAVLWLIFFSALRGKIAFWV